MSLEEEILQQGALPDDRSEDEKQKDFHFGEVVASVNPVTWVEKAQSAWRRFPTFNQNGSGSCVAQTMKKLLGVMYWLRNGAFALFSATHIYQRRSNKPQGGMIGVEAFNICRDGVTLEALVPSESMTDKEMDALGIPKEAQEVGKVFKLGNFVILPTKDIDTIASIIQTTGKAVMVWFYFEYREWNNEPSVLNPSLNMHGDFTCRHSVAAVDFTLWKGKKALIIDESWGIGTALNGQRVIDEDFFKERNFFAAYPINFAFEDQAAPKPVEPTPPSPTPGKPKFTFKEPLNFIAWNSTKNQPADMELHDAQKDEVKALQDILRYEGCFPKNTASTGYYGAVTAKAVYAYQMKHKVASQAELDSLKGRRVGEKTIAQLNKDYSF